MELYHIIRLGRLFSMKKNRFIVNILGILALSRVFFTPKKLITHFETNFEQTAIVTIVFMIE